MSSRIRLPHDETAPGKLYSMADPDALQDAYDRVYRYRFYGESRLDPDDLAKVLMLASGYLHLTTYELGQERCVSKLRDIWRARRARGDE